MDRICRCGHDHADHLKPYADTRRNEVAWCNFEQHIFCYKYEYNNEISKLYS